MGLFNNIGGIAGLKFGNHSFGVTSGKIYAHSRGLNSKMTTNNTIKHQKN